MAPYWCQKGVKKMQKGTLDEGPYVIHVLDHQIKRNAAAWRSTN
jgi:hypothetical protein